MVYWGNIHQHRHQTNKQEVKPESSHVPSNLSRLFLRSALVLIFLLAISSVALFGDSSKAVKDMHLKTSLTDNMQNSAIPSTAQTNTQQNISGSSSTVTPSSDTGGNSITTTESVNSSTTHLTVNGDNISLPSNGSFNENIDGTTVSGTHQSSGSSTNLNVNVNSTSGGSQ